ncbi:MAG: hypothetical protein QG657_5663, partial [Acidobacteriota bacterium]|nr:hypothetical protein [Acidobacteriota bacterium]
RSPNIFISAIDIISEEEKRLIALEFNNTTVFYPTDKTVPKLFEERVQVSPDAAAVASENHYLTYGELDRRAGELAGYLSDEIGIRPEDRVGIMIDMCADGVIGIMGILKAGGAYVPVAHFVPEERIKGIIKDAGIGVVCSRQKYLRKLDRFLWECADLHTYLCLDTPDIYPGDDVEESELLHLKNLWNYIGETAVDEITGGGWVSSYTGEPFSKKEMEEYGDNVLQKLAPLLNKKMKVLEIGCASGITMFRVAPRVGSYYGTDLSTVIIEKNTRRVEEEKHKNIRLAVLAAHEIDQVREKDFDLVIINSVIQDFYGLNYLRGVILKTLDLMANGAYFFFGDIMDLDMKDELIREMVEFKREHREQGYRTKTDFSGDLFISRDFFRDLRRDIPALQEPEFSSKIHTVENELTKFRYDILVKINKNTPLLITPNKRFFGVRSGGARKPLRSISPGPGWRSANSSTSPGADSLAYIMYTSGSTGRPKGVMVEHRGVVNLIHWFARTFDIRPGIHLLQLTGYSFDPSVEDIFTTLAYGATLYVGSVDLNVNRDEFKKYVDRNQVHIVDFVPSALGFLLGGEEKFKSLQVVISGGERLEDSVKDRLIARGYRLYNNYGPTEVTVDALSSECSGDRVFLGKPIANTRCYVLDKDDRLSAIGIKGELCIAGAGISRGYLNDPELSGEKFRKDLVKGERIYRTGDVVRHSPGGKIEFIGRKDNQVKIRGYRIEPGGIEKRIREIEDIEDVVVVDREKSPGNKYLCAYFVSRKDMDVTDLKNSLAKIIPDYMMPLYFMQLKKMPRKVTGKIDEKALPVPVGGHGTEAYVAPRDELEAKLAAAWADVLGMEPERIGIDDNFFELGGHSLKAAVLTAKIHRELHIKVPLAEIFQLPVIRGLAGYIKQAAKDIYTAIEVAEKKEYYLLSSAQKRMYVLQQMEDQGTGYNIPAVLLLEGQVNKQKLEDTFKCLLQRHESLRTSFEMAAGEPVQRIHDEVEFEIEQLGAKGLELGVINEKNSSKVFGPTFFQKGGFIRPFDLSCAPLLRVALRKLEKTTHLLMIDMHHIIADGVSIEVLIKEFSTIYRGGEPGALRIQYKDFSEWQNRLKAIGMFQHQEEYWRNELAGEAPKLFLPTDFPRPTVWSFAGNILEFEIGEKETARLNTLTGAANTTLFMTLLATFNVLLSKICGQEEIVVGTPVSGRGHADLENIMGMFVNTLVLRTHPVGEKSFLSFLKETRHKTLQALENQDYPFEELVQKVPVERNVSRNPLVDVMFTLQNYFAVSYDSLNQEIEGLTIKSCGYENKTAKFDLLLSAVEKEGKLVFSFEYSTQLFKEETLARFAVCFKSVIWQLTRKPRVNILNIEILSEEERAMILNDFNNTAADYPRDQKIHEIFKDQASKTPDRIALSGESVRPVGHFRLGRHIIPINLTYRQLNEQSDQLAALLIEKGLLAGDIVGIMLERSVELIIGIIGILKSGAAYMPIDPEYPEERIQYMLADSNARILLETEESQKKIIINCQLLIVNCKLKNLPKAPLHHSSFIIYHLNHLAYIMYTSGSTGEPKGVMVTHRNVVRLVKNANFVPLTEETRILQTGAPVFDASTFEIWGSLLNGGQLILAHKEVILDARRLGDALKVNRVNTLWLSAPLFHQLVQQDLGLFSILHYLLVGGDTLNPGYINRVRRQFPYLKIINGYGPTENTTFSTTYFIEKEFAYNIPIGRPIANSTAYIYDKDSHLAPIGVWGELYVGGDGVAMGYLNNPELTSKRFNRSYKTYINYKTGDLCRWLSDGSIEFLGRLDQQVKIRGFRVELAEIENRLRKHDQVKEAVVLDRKISDEKYLCAYIVPGPVSTPVAAELRAYLSRSLPEYMIPTFFEFIEKIPLNPNGKIDRKALPEPGAIAKAKEYTAPRDEIEKKLAALWEVILKPQLPIGIDDNFFDLGGHSLNATVLTTRIYKTLGVKIPLKEFFQRGSIREVAEYIKGVKKEKFVGIEPLERKEYYASSSAQRRLYFLQQLVGDNIVYNMPAAVILEGVVDKDRLQTAFKKLILRHESFRTSFEMIGTEAVQKIHEDVLFEIEYKNSSIDYTDYTDEKDYIQHFIQPFDLSSAPLMRVSVVKEEEEKHLLMVDMHHIISDGVSQGILIRDFMRLYEGKELFPLKLQYKDYAEWQSNEREPETVKQQKEFWLNEFAGEVPVLEIPTDFPRPVIQSFDGMALDFKLENNAIEALKALAKEEGATLFMVLLSLYTILLAKLSSREDIVVGTPTAGRQHADFEKIIGMFVNTLAMRNFSHGEMSFKQFLKEVKERTLAAFAQQDYPYDELVEMLAIERDTSRNPLFDAMLALQNMDIPSMEIPGLKLKPFNFMNMIAKFDLTLIIFEMGNDLSCTLEYCTKLFKQETIDRFIGYFKNIVSHVIDIPGTKIAGIDILSGQEKKRLLVEFSETGVVYPAEKTLHELFENQVEKTPDSVALVGADLRVCPVCLTFFQLNEQSNRLAGLLIEKGVRTDSIVGIMMKRSIDLIIGIIGILKCGAAYLPIDPNSPEERVQYMLADSNVRILLETEESQKKIIVNCQLLIINCKLKNLPKAPLHHSPLILNGRPRRGLHHSNHQAYIIYTSGSTGKPKAVPITHANVSPLLHWGYEHLGIAPGDRALQNLSYYFDWSVWEIFITLTTGATLYIAPEDILLNPEACGRFIITNKITVLHATPTQYSFLVNLSQRFETLQYLFIGAEKFTFELLAGCFASVTNQCRIFNMYGPTEATIIAAVLEIQREFKNPSLSSVPIGKPAANNQLLILDRHLQLCPIHAYGELFVGGCGVAMGYLNNPELTAERFIMPSATRGTFEKVPLDPSKLLSIHNLPLYKTGDLARWLNDGNIEFLGRIDHQVKIRGMRIEPGEIETKLLSYNGITEAVVVSIEDCEKKNTYLSAYFTTTKRSPIKTSELRTFLSHELPDYMIPTYFTQIERLPLNANGKLDRRALPIPTGFETAPTYETPRDIVEEKLAEIWSEVLGIKKNLISIDANFFESGGHSLKAAVLLSKIHRDLHSKMALVDVFTRPTIRELAEYVKNTEENRFISIKPTAKKEYYSLSSAQKRMYFLKQLLEDNTVYNIPTTVILEGVIDKDRLQVTFKKLIERHESFRTTFEMVGPEPMQIIHDDVQFEIEYKNSSTDYTDYTDEKDYIQHFIQPFDLSRAPLMRVSLVKKEDEKHLLIVDMHHIISDGVSQGILIREFMRLYEGKELAPLKLQYKDYAEWQNNEREPETVKQQKKFWLNEFAGEVPVLEIPTDYPRPGIQSFEGMAVDFTIENNETEVLKALAKEEGVTLFMVLLSLYTILLAKLSSREDIIVGTPTAGRGHADLEKIIGMFVNTLALRNFPHREMSFKQFLNEIKERTMA